MLETTLQRRKISQTVSPLDMERRCSLTLKLPDQWEAHEEDYSMLHILLHKINLLTQTLQRTLELEQLLLSVIQRQNQKLSEREKWRKCSNNYEKRQRCEIVQVGWWQAEKCMMPSRFLTNIYIDIIKRWALLNRCSGQWIWTWHLPRVMHENHSEPYPTTQVELNEALAKHQDQALTLGLKSISRRRELVLFIRDSSTSSLQSLNPHLQVQVTTKQWSFGDLALSDLTKTSSSQLMSTL